MTAKKPGYGITVTEISPMDQPIRWRNSSTAAFIGRALRGPLDTPVLIDSFSAYTRRFGGRWHRSSLSEAVEQFFLHGGKQLYVVRVANDARGATLTVPGLDGALQLRAIEPGSTEALRVSIDYDDAVDDRHFNLIVQRLSATSRLVVDQEIFSGACCDDSETSFIGFALADSDLVELREPLPASRPFATMGPSADVRAPYVLAKTPGSDGGDLSDYDLVGSAVRGTGLFSLDAVEELDLIYFPPPTASRDPGPAALLAAELYSRKRGALLIMDPPAGLPSAQAAVSAIEASGLASPHMIGYFPRLMTAEGERPAGGAIAGLLCKMDLQRGPWSSLEEPGYAFVRGQRPQTELDEGDKQLLHRSGLNAIALDGNGRHVLTGGVTLGRGCQFDVMSSSLSAKRFSLKMARTIERATRWAVFEQDRALAAERVEKQIEELLHELGQRGAIRAASVRCLMQHGADASPGEQGLTVLLALQPGAAVEPLSMTLYQGVSGCRIASTAFAPVEPLQLARLDAA